MDARTRAHMYTHTHTNTIFCMFIQRLSADLKRSPNTLEDLKFVLRVIANIRAISLDIELRYRDIRERYRTLVMYDVKVCLRFVFLYMYIITVHTCSISGVDCYNRVF